MSLSTPDETSAELTTAEGALAAAREILAQQFAAHPCIAKKARDHYAKHAVFTAVPTQKGKGEIDPAHLYARVGFELIMRDDGIGGYAPAPPTPLWRIRAGPGPHDVTDRDKFRSLVSSSELLLLALQARRRRAAAATRPCSPPRSRRAAAAQPPRRDRVVAAL